jgi:arylsulfatase A-like enzyme
LSARIPCVRLALVAAVVIAACRSSRAIQGPTELAPRVVLVSLDTLHVDYTSPYNPAVDSTPFLQRFAAEGTRFARAYTLAPVTLPSHAALMTGIEPSTLGVLANGDIVPESARTLAETLKESGYRTGAFVSLGVLGREFRIDQGFDLFHDPFGPDSPRWYRTAEEVFSPVEAWVRENRDHPFFLWVHFSDPHEPYLPVDAPPDAELFLDGESLSRFRLVSAERQRRRIRLPTGEHRLRFQSLRPPRPDDRPETAIFLRLLSRDELLPYVRDPLPGADEKVPLTPAFEVRLVNRGPARDIDITFEGGIERPAPSDVIENYRAEVAYTDRHLEKLDALFQSLALSEGTLFVIVSDHGEGLFHHDILGHANDVYEDQLRILWMMRGPRIPRGRVVDPDLALVTDVAPTLLDLLGIEATGMEGRSFRGCLEGRSCPAAEPFWAYAVFTDPRRPEAMAGYDWPFKWMWQRSLGRTAYDLSRDPAEENDLLADRATDYPEALRALAGDFPEERRLLVESLSRRDQGSVSEKARELLRSLGYLESGSVEK